MALEDQSTSESDSREDNDLIDRLRSANKELETKERSMVKEINMLRMNLEITNKRTKILVKKLQENENHCEKLE